MKNLREELEKDVDLRNFGMLSRCIDLIEEARKGLIERLIGVCYCDSMSPCVTCRDRKIINEVLGEKKEASE